MGKQTFSKIKKSLALLLAVLFVVAFMAASASACTTKAADNIPVNIPRCESESLTRSLMPTDLLKLRKLH